jgi:hypothetical protein
MGGEAATETSRPPIMPGSTRDPAVSKGLPGRHEVADILAQCDARVCVVAALCSADAVTRRVAVPGFATGVRADACGVDRRYSVGYHLTGALTMRAER